MAPRVLRLLAACLLVARPALADDNKIGGCVNTVPYGTAPEDPYTVSEITPTTSCDPFAKVVQALSLIHI